MVTYRPTCLSSTELRNYIRRFHSLPWYLRRVKLLSLTLSSVCNRFYLWKYWPVSGVDCRCRSDPSDSVHSTPRATRNLSFLRGGGRGGGKGGGGTRGALAPPPPPPPPPPSPNLAIDRTMICCRIIYKYMYSINMSNVPGVLPGVHLSTVVYSY